jgi:hypothetical protein
MIVSSPSSATLSRAKIPGEAWWYELVYLIQPDRAGKRGIAAPLGIQVSGMGYNRNGNGGTNAGKSGNQETVQLTAAVRP